MSGVGGLCHVVVVELYHLDRQQCCCKQLANNNVVNEQFRPFTIVSDKIPNEGELDLMSVVVELY